MSQILRQCRSVLVGIASFLSGLVTDEAVSPIIRFDYQRLEDTFTGGCKIPDGQRPHDQRMVQPTATQASRKNRDSIFGLQCSQR